MNHHISDKLRAEIATHNAAVDARKREKVERAEREYWQRVTHQMAAGIALEKAMREQMGLPPMVFSEAP